MAAPRREASRSACMPVSVTRTCMATCADCHGQHGHVCLFGVLLTCRSQASARNCRHRASCWSLSNPLSQAHTPEGLEAGPAGPAIDEARAVHAGGMALCGPSHKREVRVWERTRVALECAAQAPRPYATVRVLRRTWPPLQQATPPSAHPPAAQQAWQHTHIQECCTWTPSAARMLSRVRRAGGGRGEEAERTRSHSTHTRPPCCGVSVGVRACLRRRHTRPCPYITAPHHPAPTCRPCTHACAHTHARAHA